MNLNYLKQNIKKSKSFLAFFIGIIPIITVLMLIVGSQNNVFIPSLEELSIINYPCCYVLPIIISICLFGYVFKKKSVDFVNSMPISRKQIFITNTVGGIILILLLNLINVIIMFVLSSVMPNIVIPFSMLIDYFIFWSITYIFIFVCSNIAVSISGNMITSIAVTLLIMFLIPFVHSYSVVKEAYISNNEYSIECNNCYNSVDPVISNNYTAPYRFVFTMVENSDYGNLYNKVSLVKMFVLSVLYIFIGFILFRRRKMEVSETSFKNIHVHNFVKCLTLIPITVIFYELNEFDNFVVTLIFLVIIVGYYFIFDLITRRNITKITLNLSFLALFLVISYVVLTINTKMLENNDVVINVDDVKSISVITYQFDKAYNFSNVLSDVELKDKNLINTILSNSSDLSYDSGCGDYHQVYFTTKDNKRYKTYTCLDNMELASYKDVKEAYNDIDYNGIYAVSINGKLVEYNDLLKEIKKEMSMIRLDSEIDRLSSYDSIDAYVYEDNRLINYQFNYKLSKNIEQMYLNEINSQLIDIIDEIEIYSLSYDKSYSDDYGKIKEIIKNNPAVDVDKEYVVVMLFTNEGSYSYSTNRIDEINEVFYD